MKIKATEYLAAFGEGVVNGTKASIKAASDIVVGTTTLIGGTILVGGSAFGTAAYKTGEYAIDTVVKTCKKVRDDIVEGITG